LVGHVHRLHRTDERSGLRGLLEAFGVLEDMKLLFCSQNQVHTWDSCNLGWPQLCIATRNDDISIRGMAKRPTDHLATLSVRSLGDAACVDDTHISPIVDTDHFIPLRPKLSSNCGGFSEIEFAA
jgi:hypothetical protein